MSSSLNTPVRSGGGGPSSSSSPSEKRTLTPEQLARAEQNRLKALEKLRLKQQQQQSSSSPSPATKPTTANTTNNASPSQDKPNTRKRKERTLDLTYCDYNLTTMKDTKGGFIPEQEPEKNAEENDAKKSKTDQANNNNNVNGTRPFWDDKANEATTTAPSGATADPKLQQQQKQQNPQDLDDDNIDYECSECHSIETDRNYRKHFQVLVCRDCIDTYPEKYSLLTKTECKQDYLLTDPELKDASRLPFWEKPNPHKSTWSNMLLYLRSQVEAFAWDKWGTPEELDKEWEKRNQVKIDRKEKKRKEKLKEIRKLTRTGTWKKEEEVHVCTMGEKVYNDEGDEYTQKCTGCGKTVTFEEL